MAIYHFSAKVISRANGSSALAAAAYRSASRLHDERLDRHHDFSNKAGVVHSEVLLPEGAPERFGGWIADNIERYQTLLAGVLAICAAKIAVKPIWEQVSATNTQTQIAHLETLQKLLREALGRADKVEKDFEDALRQINWGLFDPAGEPQEVDGPTAYHVSAATGGA